MPQPGGHRSENVKTKTAQDKRVLDICEPVAQGLGYRIVRVRVMDGKRATMQLMAEQIADGSMSIDDCANLSRALSTTLEVEDPIEGAYILEVSSPGLDRPLTEIADFEIYRGCLVRLDLDRMVEGRKRFKGTLAGRDGNVVVIFLQDKEDTARIPFAWISDARLLITDEMIKTGRKAREMAESETE